MDTVDKTVKDTSLPRKQLPKDLFEEFFLSSVDLLCVAGIDGYFKIVNPSFERTLGWKEEDLLSRPFIDFVHPEDVDQTQAEVERLATGVPTISFQNRYRMASGEYKTLHWTAYPREQGSLIYAIARDHTEIIETTEQFKIALDASPAATLVVDQDGKIRLVNAEVENLFGYDREELLDHSLDRVIPIRFHQKHRGLMSGYLENPENRLMGTGRHVVAVHENGYEFPVEIGLKPIELFGKVHVIATVTDLTLQRSLENKIVEGAEELKRANERLTQLATTDELTGLLNRRAFDEQLSRHLRLMQRIRSPLSALLLDIDDFKILNDQFGHMAGDVALEELGRVLKRISRGSDIIARRGGDEFALILPNTDGPGAMKLAEKICSAVERRTWPDRDITVSVGASTIFLPDHKAPDELIHSRLLLAAADRALYEAKEAGRNQVSHQTVEQEIPAPSTESP